MLVGLDLQNNNILNNGEFIEFMCLHFHTPLQ